MSIEPNEADISQEPGSTLARELSSSRQLGIQFSPVVAFAVSCRPVETKLADKHCERSRSPMDGTCPVTANIRQGTSEVSSNFGALSHA
jgi:hypothetical protein